MRSRPLMIITVILALSGCSLTPEKPELALENKAIHETMVTAIQMNTFINDCNKLTSRLRPDMEKLKTFWWDRNNALITAVDVHHQSRFSKTPIDLTQTESLPTIAFIYEGQKPGHHVLNDRLRSYVLKERRCLQVASRIIAGRSELS